MRSPKLWFACVAAICGCGPEFAVVPRNGMDRAVAQVNGTTMVAYANQWAGDPYDLADYVTPIAIELYNASPYEVRVNYADLALRDGSGFRYAAINPYIPASMAERDATPPLRAVVYDGDDAHASVYADDGAPVAKSRVVLVAGDGPILLASHSGGGHSGGGFHGGGYHGSGARSATPVGRSGGWGYRGGGWRGYRPIGGVRTWFGLGVGYWGGPWAYPPYYYDWVYAWGPAYYPARPSDDVLSMGLPEGVLPPGASVSGFLYFKRATAQNQGALELGWELHDAQTGAPLGTVKIPLEVVHR